MHFRTIFEGEESGLYVPSDSGSGSASGIDGNSGSGSGSGSGFVKGSVDISEYLSIKICC